jgi:RimJ/RimL family protein N-acetyltransferase
MLALREFLPSDDALLISWVRTPEELFYFTGPLLSWPLDSAQLDGIRASAEQRAWTAVDATGEPIGHIEIALEGQRVGRLVRVLVAPEQRGKGYAADLVTLAMEEARALRLANLHLNVVEDNARAIAVYERLGFAHTGRLPDRDTVLTMAREL